MVRSALLFAVVEALWYTLLVLVELEKRLAEEALVGERKERLSACVEWWRIGPIRSDVEAPGVSGFLLGSRLVTTAYRSSPSPTL